MWDGFNKRRFPRVNLQCEISIQADEFAKPISAVTENVGIGGVCVILDQPLERYDRCHVRFGLGKNLPKIESHGRVMWTVPMREPRAKKSRYDTGIEFVDIDPAVQRILLEYLEQNAKDLSEV
ncbi:MAG: PilZ domain-containing protein [Candidatus Omnitrophota bacterium]|jgi:hypothetical protein